MEFDKPLLVKNKSKDYLKGNWNLDYIYNELGDMECCIGTSPNPAKCLYDNLNITIKEYIDNRNGNNPEDVMFATGDILDIKDNLTESDWINTYSFDKFIMLISNKGAHTGFHTHGSAINILISGKKSWELYDPKSPTSWKGPDYSYIPDEKEIVKITQHAGDIVIVPSNWMHSVVNETDNSICLICNRAALDYRENKRARAMYNARHGRARHNR